MEPKAKTISERFGFKDPELSTPRHDEIMIWLDENAILRPEYSRWNEEDLSRLKAKVWQQWPRLDLGNPPDILPSVAKEKVWEFPITDKSYVIGFVDMLVKVEFSGLAVTYRDGGEKPEGFIQRRYMADVAFEVKPEIRSAGEVIRQIQMYRQYLPNARFYIVCPDDRFKSILASQGIGFIKSP